MRTDDLIAQLAKNPQPAANPVRRIAVAAVAGWLAALLGMIVALGPPLAAIKATGVMPFGVKLSYTLALTVFAGMAMVAAGRPGQRLQTRWVLVGLPLLTIAALAAFELTSVPEGEWRGLLLGRTFATCVAAISIASIPVLAALMLAYRELAPTRLAQAGFLAGLSAGAAAAVAYALYCPETTASFLMASYTPAILVPALIGALLGPRLLRW